MSVARHGLIIGGTGQDGTLLARHLLDRGWAVTATGRQMDRGVPAAWEQMGIAGSVAVERLDPADALAVDRLVGRVRPDAIFCLAAQSSVGLSFDRPRETFVSNGLVVLNVLEAVRTAHPSAHVFVAGSGEVFGETGPANPATETTPFAVHSPYGAAKAAACTVARAYRDIYGLHVSIGHLFGHESALRGPDFAFGRLIGGIRQIRSGETETITLGSLSVIRDWGWAPDYVAAMERMVSLDAPAELVLATGSSVSLEQAARALFAAADLDFDRHVRIDASRTRARDIPQMHADPSRARALIGWQGSTPFPALADHLVGAALS